MKRFRDCGRPNIMSKDPKEKSLAVALYYYTNQNSRLYDKDFDKEIRRLRPEWFLNSADIKKGWLLELARSGQKRPSCSDSNDEYSLGIAFSSYTNQNSECYDAEFASQIRSLRPDWFRDNGATKRSKVLELAKCKGKRPSITSKDKKERGLAVFISHYINQNGKYYDPKLARQVRALCPEWFKGVTVDRKTQLINMASNGDARPSSHSKCSSTKLLGRALVAFTNRANVRYDPEFTKKINKLRPDWFECVTSASKSQLLDMAKRGSKRPSAYASMLGKALTRYTSSKNDCYDPVFDKKIRKLRPDWFVKTATVKKQKLLDMASKGHKRPQSRSTNREERLLAIVLTGYTRPTNPCYDLVFDKKIRKLRPDWFCHD